MKRTANKFQRAYMVAKARVQEVESQQEAIEKKFIADKGIVNPDGSVPEFLYCMEDDAAFEKANDECAALIVSAGLEEELNAARSVLKASEDSLIAYGLSLAPAGVRATLEKAVQHNAATRAKVLDLAFRLDVSTVSAQDESGRRKRRPPQQRKGNLYEQNPPQGSSRNAYYNPSTSEKQNISDL